MNPVQETRERKELKFARPRSAVRVRGEGGLFGRDFFPLLRKAKGEGPLFFFLAWCLAGVVFGIAGWVGPYSKSLQETASPRFFQIVLIVSAALFLLGLRGLEVLLIRVRAAGSWKRWKANRRRPWVGDHPWRPAGMAPDPSDEASVIGRVTYFGVLAASNLAALALDDKLVWAIVLAFDALGVWILVDSLRRIWRRLRHPQPRMRWMTLPAFLGDRLLGVFTCTPPLRVQGPVRATLRLVKEEEDDPFDGSSFSLYEQVREFSPVGEMLQELPVTFDIPSDLPGTVLSRKRAVYWQVLLKAPVAGPDFETVFLAPVYERPRQ
jgi:hypothetical protein